MKSPINADKADNCYHGSFSQTEKTADEARGV